MDNKHYVVTDIEDPGAEFDTYEEAREHLIQIQAEFPLAIILLPGDNCRSEEEELWWKSNESSAADRML